MTPRARASSLLLALVTSILPGSAHAQADADKATARELGQQGQVALDAHDWAAAADDFRKADALYHAPSLVLGLARAESHEGKVVEAWESYHRIIEENVTTSPVFAKALKDATIEIAAVEARRARLTIRVTGAAAPRVTMDDVPVKAEALGIERLVNPGHHVLSVAADGAATVTRPVDVREGGSEVVSVALEQAATGVATAARHDAQDAHGDTAAGGHPPNRALGIAALAVGGAGLLMGVITGAVALGDHSTLSNECPHGTCPGNEQSQVSAYQTMGTLSTVGFVAGGVFAAGGVVLLLTAPKATAPSTGSRVVPFVGAGTVGVVGSF